MRTGEARRQFLAWAGNADIYALGVVIEGESSIEERLKVHVRFKASRLVVELWAWQRRVLPYYVMAARVEVGTPDRPSECAVANAFIDFLSSIHETYGHVIPVCPSRIAPSITTKQPQIPLSKPKIPTLIAELNYAINSHRPKEAQPRPTPVVSLGNYPITTRDLSDRADTRFRRQ